VQFIEKKKSNTNGWKHWERKKINIVNQRLKLQQGMLQRQAKVINSENLKDKYLGNLKDKKPSFVKKSSVSQT
jgi:hypothetical protein